MQFDLDGAMGDEHSSRSTANPRATVEKPPAYPPGTVIAGRYKLLEEIGEGGMGSVWVAQQTEPVRRRVALKLIKPGMDSRQVLSRFEAERQALAVMDHPHIAKVLDGGMTDQGRPYFVMEYVKGEPITDYCDHARLSVKERLKLFVQVCQAVQHAHQKGIIHRDLKPSNILVCPYDGQPVPKVIDFGLAKAMHQSLTDHSLYTAHGVMVGTPLYMSPEQAETNNLDIDTRSDLYSLGVILYELLTGGTPLEKRRLQDAAMQEMLRLIQQEEPPKPSTRLSGSGSLPSIAAQRSLEPAQLSRAVRGDLDWIVMKSLEKDRTRRYETASGLARDIERYLHDDPVEACPPSAGYRFSKFARRNKAALVTIGLVAAALVAGTVVSTWQAIRATRAEQVAQEERREAEKQRAQAEANFKKAKAAVDEYFTLVSESKLFDVPGLQPLRKELLEAALRFYKSSAVERTNDPTVLADLAVTYMRVAEINHTVDRNEDAIAAINQALAVIERLRRDFPQAHDQHRRLSGYWKGDRRATRTTESPKDAAAAFRTLARLIDTVDSLAHEYPEEPAFRSDFAALCYRTGDLLNSNGRPAEGIAFLKRAKSVLELLLRDAPNNSEYRADLARTCEHLADRLPENTEAEVRQALSLRESLVAEFPQSPHNRIELGRSLQQYARHMRPRDSIEAENLSRRAIDLAESVVRDYPNVPLYTSELTDALLASRMKEHIDAGLRLLDDRVANCPADPAKRDQLAHLLRHVAEGLPKDEGSRPKITLLHRRSLQLFEDLVREFPENPSYREDVGHSGRFLASSTDAERNWEESLKFMAVAVDAFEALVTAKIDQKDGYYRSFHADSLNRLSWRLSRAGRVQEAAQAQQRSADSFETLTREFPTNVSYRPQLMESLGRLAKRLAASGRHVEADAAWQRVVKICEALLAEHPQDRQAREQLSRNLSKIVDEFRADPDKCEPMLRKALTLHAELADEAADGRTHLEQAAHLHRQLAWLMRGKQHLDEARQNFEQAAAIFEKLAADTSAKRHNDYRALEGDTYLHLARTLAQMGQSETAVKISQRSADIAATLADKFPQSPAHLHQKCNALGMRAEALAANGRSAEALQARRDQIAQSEQLVHAFPNYDAQNFQRSRGVAYLELARLLIETGVDEEARQVAEKAFAIGPCDAGALNDFAWKSVVSHDVRPAVAALAIEAADQATKTAPNDPMIFNTLGVAQYRAGQWEESIASLTKAEELAPDKHSGFNWFFQAMSNWQLDQKDEARTWYDKSVEWMEKNQPKNEELLRFRAEAKQLLGITKPDVAPTNAP
ncbi:MAG: protein kinase [Pirellulales bacterium]